MWTFGEEASLSWRFAWVLLIQILALLPYVFFLLMKQSSQVKGGVNRRILGGSVVNSFYKVATIRFAFGMIIIGLAQPIFGVQSKEAVAKNSEIVMTIDVSNSMNTMDISDLDSRLDVAKRACNELVNELSGERVAIVIFAGNAYSYLPITKDYAAVKLFLQDLETKMVSSQGTNLDDALSESKQLFTDENAKKVVLLMTDGENHQDMPNEVLKAYADDEIKLIVLGIGTSKGGLVPNIPGNKNAGYKRDAEGKVVQSKLNQKLILDLAQNSGGTAVFC